MRIKELVEYLQDMNQELRVVVRVDMDSIKNYMDDLEYYDTGLLTFSVSREDDDCIIEAGI